MRRQRRAEILSAFARVLADHGYAGATIAAVAQAAGVAPGLIHHHFDDKEELLGALLDDLIAGFRARVHHYEASDDRLFAYIDGALKLDERADAVAARCWVGMFSEALRTPSLFARVRRLLDGEVASLRARGQLDEQQASALLAFVIGSLVLGAFAPKKTAGFAAPAARALVQAWRVRVAPV
jgi:TetR/AcrR family transcriptional regulator, transcriptional repressor of bet genes